MSYFDFRGTPVLCLLVFTLVVILLLTAPWRGKPRTQVEQAVHTHRPHRRLDPGATPGRPTPPWRDGQGTDHVFFLKVHKAASTTVMNVLYRFALKRDLYVMLPKSRNILSESSRVWRSAAIDLPPGVPYFDILCNHIVYNEQLITASMHPDTKFVAIVRQPLSQFVSAFEYYRNVFHLSYLKNIPSWDPILTYMKDPIEWEVPIRRSYTHNRMSFDFGMGMSELYGDRVRISEYLDYLNDTFDLVMLSERFDESMVLLKRLLGWRLQDVIYIKSNVFNAKGRNDTRGPEILPRQHVFTEREKHVHRAFNAADYALYDYFAERFQKKVESEGESFSDEVKAYKMLLDQVGLFCEDRKKPASLQMSAWGESFKLTRYECELMSANETSLVNLKRREQVGKHLNLVRNKTDAK